MNEIKGRQEILDMISSVNDYLFNKDIDNGFLLEERMGYGENYDFRVFPFDVYFFGTNSIESTELDKDNFKESLIRYLDEMVELRNNIDKILK